MQWMALVACVRFSTHLVKEARFSSKRIMTSDPHLPCSPKAEWLNFVHTLSKVTVPCMTLHTFYYLKFLFLKQETRLCMKASFYSSQIHKIDRERAVIQDMNCNLQALSISLATFGPNLQQQTSSIINLAELECQTIKQKYCIIIRNERSI